MENSKQDFNLFKDKIYKYNAIAQVLHESADVEKEQDLLEEASEAESEILKCFGLPGTSEFRGILDLFCWEGNVNDKEIENLLCNLKETAANYLSSPTKSDKAFLVESKEKHLTAYDVFPIIGVEATGYNVFLYESLFYSWDYPADVIFEEMKIANTIPADVIRKMSTPLLLKEKSENEVSTIGLKFWDHFIKYEETEKRIPGKDIIQLLDCSHNEWHGIFPKRFSITEGYVSSVRFKKTNEQSVRIEITTKFDSGWMNIHIHMLLDEVIQMLKKSSNKSIASMVRSMLLERLNGNLLIDYELAIREWYDTYLFCEGLDWAVTMLELEDDNGNIVEDHNYYELTPIW